MGVKKEAAQCGLQGTGSNGGAVGREDPGEVVVGVRGSSNDNQHLEAGADELFARGNKPPSRGAAQKVIDDLHRKIGQLQSRRLQVSLLREGISVGRRRIRRLMRKLGL